jgi:hypothetical protein
MGHLPSALDLARAQFAFVVVWHFLFPAFTIGLASFLAVLEALWLITKRSVFLDVFQYWLRIFAIAFAMGVVSGVVMSYQFGTNWSAFSDKVGPVIGPFLGYEVLTAFFLEAGFLGHAVRTTARWPLIALRCHKLGRPRHFDLYFLDTCRQQLDANPGRIYAHAGRTLLASELGASNL